MTDLLVIVVIAALAIVLLAVATGLSRSKNQS